MGFWASDDSWVFILLSLEGFLQDVAVSAPAFNAWPSELRDCAAVIKQIDYLISFKMTTSDDDRSGALSADQGRGPSSIIE